MSPCIVTLYMTNSFQPLIPDNFPCISSSHFLYFVNLFFRVLACPTHSELNGIYHATSGLPWTGLPDSILDLP